MKASVAEIGSGPTAFGHTLEMPMKMLTIVFTAMLAYRDRNSRRFGAALAAADQSGEFPNCGMDYGFSSR